MKRFIRILALCFMLLTVFTACKSASLGSGSDHTGTTAPEAAVLPLPQETVEFSFLSGAGAWRSILTLHADGSFTGWYLDSEMGDIGDGYPKGTAYVCNFSGTFGNIAKQDGYSYTMTLTQIRTEKAAGEEWITDGIRYISSEPHGLTGGTDFVFYLPTTPIDSLSEEFLSWWPYRYDMQDAPKDTLSCYGILNRATEQGFFNA